MPQIAEARSDQISNIELSPQLTQITEAPPQPPPLQLTHTPSIVPLRSDLPSIPELCCATCRNTVHTYLNSLRGWGPTDPPSEQVHVPTRPIPDNKI